MLTIRREQRAALAQAALAAFGRQVLDSLRGDAPEVLHGLSEAEVRDRLTRALEWADLLNIVIARDLRTFIRLCFLIGPDFCSYEPFESLLAASRGGTACVLDTPRAEDWTRVAIEEVIGRYYADLSSASARHASAPSSAPPLLLEPLSPNHAGEVYRHGSHPDIWRLASAAPLLSVDAVLEDMQHAATMGARRYAVYSTATGFAGVVALDRLGEMLELSYWIRRDWWGKGMATAAINALWHAEALSHPPSTVVAHCSAQNFLSLGVLRKTGFVALDRQVPGSLLRFTMLPKIT